MAPINSIDLECGQNPNFNDAKVGHTSNSRRKLKDYFIWIVVVLGIVLTLGCLVLFIFTFMSISKTTKTIPGDKISTPKFFYELTSQRITSIQDVCSITTYPNECFSTLKGLKDLSWPSYMQETLKASLLDIEDARKGWKVSLSALPTKNGIQYSTIQQCIEDYKSAQSTIKDALFLVQDSNVKLPHAQLNDLNQYISAASTFHGDCLDAVQDYGLIGADDIPFASKFNGEHLKELLSNALALLE